AGHSGICVHRRRAALRTAHSALESSCGHGLGVGFGVGFGAAGGGFAGVFSFGGRFLFPDQGGAFADAFAEVSQFGPAHFAAAFDLHFFDAGRVDGENAFHAFAVADPADSERLVETAAAPADDDAGKNLDSFLVAFHDFGVDADGIADIELGGFLAELFRF